MPSSRKSWVVSRRRTSPSMWCSRNAGAYCSSPRPRSHSAMSIGIALKTASRAHHTAGLRQNVQTELKLRPDVTSDSFDEPTQIGLQAIEAGKPFQGLLVHIKGAVDLDLQAVPVLRRAALAPDDLDALVALIDANVIAVPAQEAGDEFGELAGAGGAVAVAQHKVAMLALDALPPIAARWHRMAVDVPDRTELPVQLIASLVEHAMIRRVIALDPGQNLLGAQLAVVDRNTRLGVAPDETDAG